MSRIVLLLLCTLPVLAWAQGSAERMRSLAMPWSEEVARDADGKVRLHAQFVLCIDAQGRIACLEPVPGQNPALVNAVMPLVTQWRFRAVARDGAPADAQTTLHVSVEGEPDSRNQYRMRVTGTWTGPRGIQRPRPIYPQHVMRRARQGGVLVRAEVRADGTLGRIEAVQEYSDRAFVAATLQALRRWTFEPERIGGEAVATVLHIPVVFRIPGAPPPKLRWIEHHAQLRDEPLALDSPVRRVEEPEG